MGIWNLIREPRWWQNGMSLFLLLVPRVPSKARLERSTGTLLIFDMRLWMFFQEEAWRFKLTKHIFQHEPRTPRTGLGCLATGDQQKSRASGWICSKKGVKTMNFGAVLTVCVTGNARIEALARWNNLHELETHANNKYSIGQWNFKFGLNEVKNYGVY